MESTFPPRYEYNFIKCDHGEVSVEDSSISELRSTSRTSLKKYSRKTLSHF
ncbi:hypothetical protein BsWGS_05666 [Bradybaena similaris]